MAAEGVAMWKWVKELAESMFGPVQPPAPPRPRYTVDVTDDHEQMLLFAAKLRLARSKARIKQTELAELVDGASAWKVHLWENAKASPSPSQMLALRRLFGSSLA